MSIYSSRKSPTSRLVYVLVALLPTILLSLCGIHNLVAGYTWRGVIQLAISFVVWITLLSGIILFLPLCLSIPLALALDGWAIYEACTVTHDAQGRPFS